MDVDVDAGWEICNPVDDTTGLIYDSGSLDESHYLSGAALELGDAQGGSSSHVPPPGECYAHFSNHLRHGYQTALCVESPSSTPILLVERSYNPPPIRQKMMEILFEEHAVPASFFARDAVCACYAVGRTTGTVVDVGHSGTVVTPVVDGFVETRGIRRSPVGGKMMAEMVLQHLDGLYRTKKARMKWKSPVDYVMPLYQVRAEGHGHGHLERREPFHSLARMDMARLCMESGTGAGVAAFGYTALHDLEGETASGQNHPNSMQTDVPSSEVEPSEMYQQYANAPKAPYKLPDGTVVDISQTKRFDVAELLFGKGGKSAKIRQEAWSVAKKRLDAMRTLSAKLSSTEEDGRRQGGSNIEMDAIAQMEEMTRRKRNVRGLGGENKKVSVRASHQSLLRACAPYLENAIGELTASSLPSMICESAFQCDREQQPQLLGNAILCGGGACLATSVLSSSNTVSDGNAMPERIQLECEAILQAQTPGWKVKVFSPGITERSVCSWLGASILGSLGSFHEMWVTKAQYEEYGAAIVHRKCP